MIQCVVATLMYIIYCRLTNLDGFNSDEAVRTRWYSDSVLLHQWNVILIVYLQFKPRPRVRSTHVLVLFNV